LHTTFQQNKDCNANPPNTATNSTLQALHTTFQQNKDCNLNPMWVEWLMGFPLHTTFQQNKDCNPPLGSA